MRAISSKPSIQVSKTIKPAIQEARKERGIRSLASRKPSENLIVAFEAKSYLDSPGVSFKEIKATHKRPKGRYKIFTCKGYREVVLKRLKAELIKRGMATKKTEIKLGLIAAKVKGKDAEKAFADYMAERILKFWGPSEITDRLNNLAKCDYENNVSVIVSKILTRHQK